MTALYVATGGGGDALAAAIVHRALGRQDPAIIATYAWERLVVDPLPGPRGIADFTGLRRLGAHAHAVVAGTAPRPPCDSTLPRLAADLGHTLVLLDPAGGAAGLAAQIDEAAAAGGAGSLTVIDVGGDVVARGDEAGLRSPLADGLALAATARLDRTAQVLVAGPGLDGELSEAEVLAITGDTPRLRLTGDDVTPVRSVFTWHPSESTALLVAAARGLRGRAEIRDAALGVPLTDRSPGVHALPLATAVAGNRLAAALVGTTALDEVEDVTRRICGASEIDYERTKAAARDAAPRGPVAFDQPLDERVTEVEAAAAARGVDFLTFRRIAEAVGLPAGAVAALRDHLVATRPDHHVWPLWSLTPPAAAGDVAF
ncbi:MAG TPA: DUF1152 domain-containing protein [Acidimicrobiales bacterium]|nr:DUF1152 domain-containing protein [Acidimicrobiales bacterium]